MLTLGEHRSLEASDLVQIPPRAGGDLVGRGAGADHRLHLAGTHIIVDGDLQLAQPRTIPSRGSPKRVVDPQAEFFAGIVGHDEVLAVIVHPDESQVAHQHSLSSIVLAQTLPPAGPEPGTHTPRRYRVSMSDSAAEHPFTPMTP